MKQKILAAALLLLSPLSQADDHNGNKNGQDAATEKQLQQRITELETRLNQKLDIVADALDQQTAVQQKSGVYLGGYGEVHVNLLSNGDEDIQEVDLHRFVLFLGYEFSDKIRLVSELEVEHVIASAGNRGAVELEQAYIEFDLASNMHLQAGLLLMPVGILNETHEPPTFYGTERPIVETTVIPTTWYVNAVKFIHKFDNGVKYQLMVSEGFKTGDPNSDVNAEPFNLKAGKQKGSFASLYDPALTATLTYTGLKGLELAAYAQIQPDIDQSAELSYAEGATLIGGHVIYRMGDFTAKALAANWTLDGSEARLAGKHHQEGGYLELNWRPLDSMGFFVRQSAWTLTEGVDATQTDLGLNYYPHQNVVIKADFQTQNDDAGAFDGLNFGIGYQF